MKPGYATLLNSSIRIVNGVPSLRDRRMRSAVPGSRSGLAASTRPIRFATSPYNRDDMAKYTTLRSLHHAPPRQFGIPARQQLAPSCPPITPRNAGTRLAVTCTKWSRGFSLSSIKPVRQLISLRPLACRLYSSINSSSAGTCLFLATQHLLVQIPSPPGRSNGGTIVVTPCRLSIDQPSPTACCAAPRRSTTASGYSVKNGSPFVMPPPAGHQRLHPRRQLRRCFAHAERD